MSDILAILDSEKEYVIQLMEYLKQKKELDITVVAFTDGIAYLEYEISNQVAILLYQENYDAIVINQSKAKQKLCLAETKRGTKDCLNIFIFKYQSAEIILKEILKVYEGDSRFQKKELSDDHKFIIGVCSPTHDSFREHIALSLAYEYGKSKRTLFVSLDPFLTSKTMGTPGDSQELSELIYFLKQKNNNLGLKITSLINRKDTFDYIVGATHWSDLIELLEEDTNYLMDEIKTQMEYDIVIIDISTYCNVTANLLEHCDKIYEVIYESEINCEKEREFRRQLTIQNGETIVKRLSLISINSLSQMSDLLDWKCMIDGKLNNYVRELLAREDYFVGSGAT